MTADTRRVMRRHLCFLLVAAASWLVVGAGSAAAATVKAPIPADLQALLARGAQLHIPFAIVQSSSALNAGTGFSDAVSTPVARLSPPELATTTGSGAQAERERLTGGWVY